MATLTKEQRIAIARRWKDGERNKTALAKEFGTSARSIYRVVEQLDEILKEDKPVVVVAPRLVVGDLLVGKPNSGYVITDSETVVKVNKLLRTYPTKHTSYHVFDINVTVLTGSHAGKGFDVNSNLFEKIGHHSEQGSVDLSNEFKAEFALGDTVRFKKVDNCLQLFSDLSAGMVDELSAGKGAVGKVIGVDPTNPHGHFYKVSFGKNNYDKYWLSPALLEFVKSESTPAEPVPVAVETPVEPESDVEEVVSEPVDAASIITDIAITLSFESNLMQVDYTHQNFDKIKEAIQAGEYRRAAQLMDVAKAITDFTDGELQIEKGMFHWRGIPVANALSYKIANLMASGDETFKGFAKFFARVMTNPSLKTRERLMDFVAADDIFVNEDGRIITFKNVRSDFRPSRSGKWERGEDGRWTYDKDKFYTNRVGDICEMPREEVDDVEDNTCSKGLHVCSVYYLKSCWGTDGHTMKVLVDPADVVAIPTDYKNSKARVCRYEVVEEVTENLQTYLDMIK